MLNTDQARSVRGGPEGRAPPAFCLTPPAFFLRRAFVHAWPPHGSGGPLLQNFHATGLTQMLNIDVRYIISHVHSAHDYSEPFEVLWVYGMRKRV